MLPILVHTPDPAIEARTVRLPAEARQQVAESYRHIPSAAAALGGHFLPARLGATISSRIRWLAWVAHGDPRAAVKVGSREGDGLSRRRS